MKLSGLSLIYVALSAFVAASMLIVHMNYGATDAASRAAPLSFGEIAPALTNPADTATLWTASAVSAIEM